MLPDVDGLDVIELGCGTAYWSAWLARRGARPVGLDNSSRQLATARVFQEEFDLRFPLVHADAERAPFRDESFDLAFSEYGAAIWCDPYRWIPEAARLLRPGGRLIFLGGHPLLLLCYPKDDDVAPAGFTLSRDFFGMHRTEWHDENGVVDGVEFRLPPGEMIRLFRSNGFEIEDLVEIQVPDGATTTHDDVAPPESGQALPTRADLEGPETPKRAIWSVDRARPAPRLAARVLDGVGDRERTPACGAVHRRPPCAVARRPRSAAPPTAPPRGRAAAPAIIDVATRRSPRAMNRSTDELRGRCPRVPRPRCSRARRAPLGGRTDPAALHGPARAHRTPAHVAGDPAARTLGRRRRRGAHRGACPERGPDEDRSRRRRQPALHRGDAGDGGEGDGEVVVPPTLQALLASRLDQLDAAERSVLERGSIEGEIFHRGAIQALAPEGTTVTPLLAALARKELIAPERPQLAGEDGFRFRHILIRDAAYDALPKSQRADLHERLASWFEQQAGQLLELDEIVGYHLERACRYREELGLPADDRLTSAARVRLRSAAHRAGLRQDYGAVVSLLERAAALAPAAELDLALETEIGDALIWMGRGDEALHRAEAFTELASASGDHVGELCGRIQGGDVRLYSGAERATEELEALVEQALPLFEAAGDDMALYLAYGSLCEVAEIRGRWDAGMEPYERSIVHARRAGYTPPSTVGRRAAARFFGMTPVEELLAWLDANEPTSGQDQFLLAYRAGALAMRGDFVEARGILAQMRTELAERGGGMLLANITAFESVDVELLAGDPTAAARFAVEGFGQHEELGEQTFLSAAAGNLAKAMYALDALSTRPTPGPVARPSSARPRR